MRRMCILLCLVFLMTSCAVAESVPANPAAGGAGPAPSGQPTDFALVNEEIFANQWARFEEFINGYTPIVLSYPNGYRYFNLIEDTAALDAVVLDIGQTAFDSKGNPTVEDYIDILAALMVLCDSNSAVAAAEAAPAGIGDTLPDALYAALKTGIFAQITKTSAMEVSTAEEKALKEKKEEMGELLSMMLDTEDGLIEVYEDVVALNNAVERYLCCDRLLAEIEHNSDGDLQNAASLLRYTNSYRVTASLKTILDTGVEADFVSLLTGGEISLPTDEIMDAASFEHPLSKLFAYAFAAIDTSASLLKQAGISDFEDYWEMMKQGGSLISDIGFGLSTVSKRLCELRVLHDIVQSLSTIYDQQLASIRLPDQQLMQDTLLTLKCLMYCHMQGESTLYYMVTQEMGLMSLLAFSSEPEFDLWYLKTKQTLHAIETRLNEVLHSHGLVGAVIPLDDPYMDFSRMEAAIEAPNGREISRTRLYEDGVYVFHEPNEQYVTLKLYIDGELDKTIEHVDLNVEGEIYVRRDILLFDSPYPAFVKQLIEQYGRSDLSKQEARLSWGSGTDRWPQRRGIAGADVIDLNADGYEELLVYQFVNNGNDTSTPNALRLYIYRTDEQGEVEICDWIDLLESRTRAYCHLRAGIVTEYGQYPRIYTERVERNADGYSLSYESYVFDGYTVQSEWQVGGYTGYYGGLSMSDTSGNLTWLWLGPGELEEGFSSISDLGNAEWASLTSSDAVAVGLRKMIFAPLTDLAHNDEGNVVSFPTRSTGNEYSISFEYFCQSGNYDSKSTWAADQSMLDRLLMPEEE